MSYEEEKNALKEEFDVKFAALAKEEAVSYTHLTLPTT